jgi:hypothetical protein
MAYRSIPLQATYCAAKFAIRGFTDALRVELMHEHSRVRVTMVQLPGLNTPQFTWVRTTLRRHPRPVPPVFAPSVAADAIVFAAGHRRREVWVGGNSAVIIALNKLLPWAGDRFLAATNVQAQQQDDWPIPPDRPDYLYAPLDDAGSPRGTDGPFGDEAKGRSVQLMRAKHRAVTVLGTAALTAAAALGTRAARSSR